MQGMIHDVMARLAGTSAELKRAMPLSWRYPPATPRDPKNARPRPSWPMRPAHGQGPWKKNRKNWFYASVVFPETYCGIRLAGAPALAFVDMWVPFTLWLDGHEVFREERPWKASGPIVDPHVFTIRPGQPHRLVLCVEPTELPNRGTIPTGLSIRSRPALEQAVQLDAAILQLALANVLARTGGERALVARAARAFSLAALQAHDWPAVNDSLAVLDRGLAPLSPRAKALTIHAVGHAHLDMDWMWTWRDTVHCMRRDFKAVTDLMADHPEVTFTHSQISSYATIRRTDPGIFRKVQRLIREGRWENAAGTWVEGDLNMADGEAVARHMLYAADWSKRHLGGQARVLWEPDTFGHPGNMPQLARLGEFSSYFHMRCNPGGQDNWAARLWTGLDGTSIPAFSLFYNGALLPDEIRVRVLPQFAAGARDALLIWGIGDHGGALARYTLRLLETYRHKPLVPTLRFNTLSGVLRAFQDHRFRWRRNRGETFSLFEGCFTTHASIKRYNRACEGALLSAESLCVLAGLDRVTPLREAWIPTLFNQFHDLLDGAAVHDSYRDAHRRAERSLRAAARITRQTLHTLAGPGAGKGRTLTVVNPLGFERTEPVRVRLPQTTRCLLDEAGAVIPVQRLDDQFVFVAQKVPAFSCRTYRIAGRLPRGHAAPAVAVTETHAPANEPTNTFRIETPRAVIHVARDSGIIASFHDKALNREFIPYGVPRYLSHTTVTRKDLAMNVFQVVDESPNSMSAWLIHDIRREENLVAGARVTLLEAGPVFARIRVKHRFRASSLEEDILVYQDHPRVDFELRLNWREKGSEAAGVPQLKVGFHASVRAPRLRTEGPFTVAERAADGQEQATQKWADLSGDEGGVTLYNDSRYGCDALGGRLRLTLLRNPYGPDRDPDSGRHVARFALELHGPGLPNAGPVRGGLAFNRPLLGVVTARPARRARPPAFEILGAPAVVVTALRRAEHSPHILVRLFETAGRPCRAVLRAGRRLRSAQAVNFLENPAGPSLPARQNRVSCSFRPFEVKTLRLDADW